MGFFDRFRKKSKATAEPVKESSPKPLKEIRKSVKTTTDRNTEILLSISKKLKQHDRYVKQNIAKELTIKELIETLEKRVNRVPLGKETTRLKQLTPNHEKILRILSHDSTRFYSYSELADMTRLTPDGVRSMVSEMARILKGKVEFIKSKEGRKVVIKLSGLESNALTSPPSESNESDSATR